MKQKIFCYRFVSLVKKVLPQTLTENRSRQARDTVLTPSLSASSILQLDVCEEGLFRVAAPTLKIRRLASLMDTDDCSDEQVCVDVF